MIAAIKSLIKNLFFPYIPLKKGVEVWEKQFHSGHWDYLGDINQLSRYSIIVGYFTFWYEGKNILDLGCGQGVLLQRLKIAKFNSYVGVDLSQKAIELAEKHKDERVSFYCEKIEDYQPNIKFEMIVFNESLYYLSNPVSVIQQYFNYLTDDGKIVISMWDYKQRNNKLWKVIDKNFKVLDDIHLQKIQTKSAWILKVITKINFLAFINLNLLSIAF